MKHAWRLDLFKCSNRAAWEGSTASTEIRPCENNSFTCLIHCRSPTTLTVQDDMKSFKPLHMDGVHCERVWVVSELKKHLHHLRHTLLCSPCCLLSASKEPECHVTSTKGMEEGESSKPGGPGLECKSWNGIAL